MTEKLKSLFSLHFSIILFGFAGLFGRMQVPSIVVVLGRVFFASLFLMILSASYKRKEKISFKNLTVLFGAGILLALHWLTFFHSIALSSVSVGLISFSTFPVFVVFMEPLFFKTKIKTAHIAAAFVVFSAIFLIIPDYDFSDNITQGVVWGVFSGFLFSLITLINRKFVRDVHPVKIAFIQDSAAFFTLIPFGYSFLPSLSITNVMMLILLGVFCTGIAHTFYIFGLKHSTARKASILTSMEPVYGALAAFVIFHETPGLKVIAGGIIIVAVSIFISFSENRNSQ